MQERQGRHHQKPEDGQGRQQGDLHEVDDNTRHRAGREGQVLPVLYGTEVAWIVMIHVALVRKRRRQEGNAKQDVPTRTECTHAFAWKVRDFVDEDATSVEGECGNGKAGEV